MSAPDQTVKPEVKTYIYGFILAVVLTIIPFGLAATQPFDRTVIVVLISAFAAAQVFVHLFFFLHYSHTHTPLEARIALWMAALMVAIMIGGSMWVMTDLHDRMMP